jgi:hypothetical protein
MWLPDVAHRVRFGGARLNRGALSAVVGQHAQSGQWAAGPKRRDEEEELAMVKATNNTSTPASDGGESAWDNPLWEVCSDEDDWEEEDRHLSIKGDDAGRSVT